MPVHGHNRRSAHAEAQRQLVEFYQSLALADDFDHETRSKQVRFNVPVTIDWRSLLEGKTVAPKKSESKKKPSKRLGLSIPSSERASAMTNSQRPDKTRSIGCSTDNNFCQEAEVCDTPMHLSVLGPSPRSSLLVTANKKPAIAMILVSGNSLKVVPVVGCGGSPSDSWRVADLLFNEVQNRVVMPTRGSGHQRHMDLRRQLQDSEDVWTQLLNDVAMSAKPSSHRNDLLSKAFDRSKIPIGSPSSAHELFSSWIMSQGAHVAQQQEDEAGLSRVSNTTCLICFDDILMETEISHLTPCGHCVCIDCWNAYLRSNASSGLPAHISCPAQECKASIGLLDAAHVLFQADTGLVKFEKLAVFERLVRNELEQYGTQTKNGRFCPHPGCGRILIPSSRQEAVGDGMKIVLCSCGMTLCADCPTTGRSHPGTSCIQYRKLRDDIDSGKADAEYESHKYLIKNSRPCPRCCFPIEKNGGCNHIWCGKCSFYFCWMCGGPGHNCRSYMCLNANKLWHQASDNDIAGYEGIRSRVEKYRHYRQSESNLVRLERAIQSFQSAEPSAVSDRVNPLVFERQLLLFILWLQAYSMNSISDDTELCTQLRSLGLVRHASEIRQRILSSHERLNGDISREEVARTMGVGVNLKSKKLTKRKKQSIEQRQRLKPEQNFTDLIADRDLEDLCVMSTDSFTRAASNALVAAACFLKKRTTRATNHKQRRKKNRAKSILSCNGNLNMKKAHPRDPWKAGMRVLRDKIETLPQEKHVRWKGKQRVKSLRLLVLGNCYI